MNGAGESNLAPLQALSLDPNCSSSIVKLNVGGVLYATSVGTLRAQEGSWFDVLLSGRWSKHAVDTDNGCLFVDRDGEVRRGGFVAPRPAPAPPAARTGTMAILGAVCSAAPPSRGAWRRRPTHTHSHGAAPTSPMPRTNLPPAPHRCSSTSSTT